MNLYTVRKLASHLAIPLCSIVKVSWVWRHCPGTYHVVRHPGCDYHLYLSIGFFPPRVPLCVLVFICPKSRHTFIGSSERRSGVGKCSCSTSISCVGVKLKLNDDKTEAPIKSPPRISNSVPLPDSLTAGNSTVRFSQSAKYLGVTLDMHLTITVHVVNLIRTVNFELRRNQFHTTLPLCSSH